jgi:hypothetical protein
MTPNGRERVMELRAGAKGTGKLIARVSYWPWSAKSCEVADEYIFTAARREGYEVPPAEDWVE